MPSRSRLLALGQDATSLTKATWTSAPVPATHVVANLLARCFKLHAGLQPDTRIWRFFLEHFGFDCDLCQWCSFGHAGCNAVAFFSVFMYGIHVLRGSMPKFQVPTVAVFWGSTTLLWRCHRIRRHVRVSMVDQAMSRPVSLVCLAGARCRQGRLGLGRCMFVGVHER